MKQPFAGVGYAATAYAIMQRVYDAGMREDKSPQQIVRAIQDAYPWNTRRSWRYKAWLAARREFFERHRLPGLRDTRSIEEIAEDNNLISEEK